jgi:HemY protein
MIRLFGIVLLALLGATALAHFLLRDPGYVLIDYGDTSIETSLWVALFLLILSFAALYALLRLITLVLSERGRTRRWWLQKKSRRARGAQLDGVLAYVEGRFEQAQKALASSAANAEMPMLNYLLAARAAHALGDTAKTAEYLHQAEQVAGDKNVAVLLAQADLQLQSQQHSDALATLSRLRQQGQRNPLIQRQLAQVYRELKHWRALLELAPALKKSRSVSAGELHALQREAAIGLLDENAVTADALPHLRKLWSDFDASLKTDADVVLAYSQHLRHVGALADAEAVVLHAIKKHWDDRLVHEYGLTAANDVAKQLQRAESWLNERPSNAALRLCIGRLALRNELWGKAREQLEASFKLSPNTEVLAELGRLYAQLGDERASLDCYRQGVLLSAPQLPALPLPPKK